MPGDDDLRLFVAIELPDATKQHRAQASAALESASPPRTLRIVRPEGIHITLKFLGATPSSSVPAIVDALTALASAHSPLTLRLGRPGSFGGARNVRVAWIGVEGDSHALALLAAAVDVAVAPFGYAPERRPFAAHLTLARVRHEASAGDRLAIFAAIAALPQVEAPPFAVTHVALMRSTLGPGGARYDALARLRLVDAATSIDAAASILPA